MEKIFKPSYFTNGENMYQGYYFKESKLGAYNQWLSNQQELNQRLKDGVIGIESYKTLSAQNVLEVKSSDIFINGDDYNKSMKNLSMGYTKVALGMTATGVIAGAAIGGLIAWGLCRRNKKEKKDK